MNVRHGNDCNIVWQRCSDLKYRHMRMILDGDIG